MIKRLLLLIICAVIVVSACGCLFRKAVKKYPSPLPPYSGLKAKISVADFDVKADKADSEIGSGLREMLITALKNSNRFILTERQNQATDLVILVTIAEFEPQASGGKAGIGGGGVAASGELGGLLDETLNKAHLALDIQIVNAATSEILTANRIQAQAQDISGGAIQGNPMSKFFGGWLLSNGLSAYANAPMENAMQICLIESVRYISQAIPASYYKY